MNFYSHHIGDFNNATRHLDRMERAIYREMLDLYYDTEAPLPLDFKKLCHKLCARREGEPEIVQSILDEFFTKTDDGWVHQRCERELTEYRKRVEQSVRAGKASAERRLNSRSTPVEPPLNDSSTTVQPTNNHKPITNNHKPETNKKTKAPDGELFVGVEPQVVEDFLAMRKKQNAPVTKTAIDGIDREARKAGMSLEAALRVCCERSWRGFKADWVKPQHAQPPMFQTAADKRQSFADALTGRNRERTANDIIDIN